MTVNLSSIETWPTAVLRYLDSEREVLLEHARMEKERMEIHLNSKPYRSLIEIPGSTFHREWERAALAVLDLLSSIDLTGWHCTRLTDCEVEDIQANGISLPSRGFLQDRIRRLSDRGLIDDRVAERLIVENQADDTNRKDRLWFCFFSPCLAGQHGIERFFRRWGGEALYNSHEQDADTGEILKTIGEPYLIQVNVPISGLNFGYYLGNKILRRYLLEHGFDTGEGVEHEDFVSQPIAPDRILRFVEFDDAEFSVLTGCDDWEPPL